jgi:ribose 5-phosphate isomerase A
VVDRLADTFPLPVEVVPFAVGPVRRSLELGFEVVERPSGHDGPYRTDNGNAMLDCRMRGRPGGPGGDRRGRAADPGWCETGLFIDLARGAARRDDGGSTGSWPRTARA